MPLFIYTLVKVDKSRMNVKEDTGLIYGKDVNQVIENLSSFGYLVRDIREANRDDVRIARLKDFRNDIASGPARVFLKPANNVKHFKSLFWLFWFLLFLVIGVIIWQVLIW